MKPVRIALAQSNLVLGNPAANHSRLLHWAERAADAGVQLLLLPELWDVGYDHEQWPRVAAPLNEEVGQVLARTSQQHGLYVATSVLERAGGNMHNTAVLFSPQGNLLGSYRKTHLFGPLQEDRYLQPGRELTMLDLPWGRTGLAICYDLRFPEFFLAHALGGAVCMLLVAEWPQARIEHWRTLLRARAIENQFFVLACNRVGQDESGEYGGHSTAIGPWGEVLVEGGRAEALLVSDMEIAQVQEALERLAVLSDLRPELYGPLAESG